MWLRNVCLQFLNIYVTILSSLQPFHILEICTAHFGLLTLFHLILAQYFFELVHEFYMSLSAYLVPISYVVDVRLHGLLVNTPILTSQMQIIFVKRYMVLWPECVTKSFQFVLTLYLHFVHLLKLARVAFYLFFCHILFVRLLRIFDFVFNVSDLGEIRPILPQLLDGMYIVPCSCILMPVEALL